MNILVKNRDAAQVTTRPLGLVCAELGIDRLEEGTHERDFERWANNVPLAP